MSRSPRLGLLLACVGLAGAGCAGAHDEPDGQSAAAPTTDIFLAFAADFQGFQSWPHFPAEGDGGAGDPVHADPTLVEYVNHVAPAASATFPVGTMIVKEGTQGDPLQRQFFAMVKRGGNYNTTGAVGWEWFELQNLASPPGAVTIVWRGFGPPAGDIYGGDAKGGCNECHVNAPHDAVFATQALE